MSPAPFRPAFIQLNVECAFLGGYDSRVAQTAKRATQAHQLSIRHFCDLKPELLNVELLKAVVIGDLALVIFRGRREAGER